VYLLLKPGRYTGYINLAPKGLFLLTSISPFGMYY